MSESLEKIKRVRGDHLTREDGTAAIAVTEFKWLIQQAERVEEFEEALKFYADPRIWKYGKQVEENQYEMPEANNDGGKTARKVLRKINAI